MKTLIFDMYGVIIKDPEGNLMPFIKSAFTCVTEEDVCFYWLKAAVGEIKSLDFWVSLGCTGDPAIVEKSYLDTIELNEDFHHAARKLQGRYRLALLSNDLSEWSAYLRKKFDLDRYFEVIAVSGDIGIKKPDPEIYRYLLRKLGQPASECIFVDDRVRNLLAARNLGMDVILFGGASPSFEGKTARDFRELTDMLI